MAKISLIFLNILIFMNVLEIDGACFGSSTYYVYSTVSTTKQGSMMTYDTCWKFDTGSSSYGVQVQITSRVGWGSSCTTNYVELLNGNSEYSSTLKEFCSYSSISSTYKSSGRYLTVKFRSSSIFASFQIKYSRYRIDTSYISTSSSASFSVGGIVGTLFSIAFIVGVIVLIVCCCKHTHNNRGMMVGPRVIGNTSATVVVTNNNNNNNNNNSNNMQQQTYQNGNNMQPQGFYPPNGQQNYPLPPHGQQNYPPPPNGQQNFQPPPPHGQPNAYGQGPQQQPLHVVQQPPAYGNPTSFGTPSQEPPAYGTEHCPPQPVLPNLPKNN